MMRKCIPLLIATVFFFKAAQSQERVYWPSPEVEQMYRQAKDLLSRGAVDESIVLFQQAVQLAPGILPLHKDLAQAFNLARKYDEAEKTIKPILESGRADAQTYQIAGAALMGQGKERKAEKIVEEGIEVFPNAGILYHELAAFQETDNDPGQALKILLQGIRSDPFYHLNYYEAARLYLNTEKPVWTLIYGEIFVNMERQTNRSQNTRKMMLEAYQKIFRTVEKGSVPKYGEARANSGEDNFEDAVMLVFKRLAPVMSDGITTDNLTMLRTRFAMEWNRRFAYQYPFTLFSYHDKMLRDGRFDAYNQWLFGAAENPNQYQSWTKFHDKAMPALESWVKANPYKPTAGDFYNSGDVNVFYKKKRGKG